MHDDHPVLRRDRQSSHQNRLEDREHRGRHADAERKESQDGDREAGRALERAHGVADVAEEGVHGSGQRIPYSGFQPSFVPLF
jgi:hypothetical protein